MFKPLFLVMFFTLALGLYSEASILGDEFMRLGQKINQTSSLTNTQVSQLNEILMNAQNLVNNGQANTGYICLMGTLHGPNGFQKWTGDSNACGDRNKINIGYNYACAMGTVYGPNGFEKWSGDSSYCGKVTLD